MTRGYSSTVALTLGALALIQALEACNGDAFQDAAGQAGSGGSGGAAMSTGGGEMPAGGATDSPSPAAGARADAGEGNVAGAAGSGDAPETCPQIDSLAELAFAPSEPFEVINASADVANLRFARALPGDEGLLYARDFFGSHAWLTSDPRHDAGAALAPPVSADGRFEGAALVPGFPTSAALSQYDFFFQRTVNPKSVQLELLGGKLSRSGEITDVERLPAPFNPPVATVAWGYGLALADNRAIWTINTNGVLDVSLHTSTLEQGASAALLEPKLPNGCIAKEIDFAPWLSRDGRTLFFASRHRNDECDIVDASSTALFALKLDEQGQQQGDSRELSGLAGSSVTDASLSWSGCWLYYSSSSADSPQQRLYRAHLAK